MREDGENEKTGGRRGEEEEKNEGETLRKWEERKEEKRK